MADETGRKDDRVDGNLRTPQIPDIMKISKALGARSAAAALVCAEQHLAEDEFFLSPLHHKDLKNFAGYVDAWKLDKRLTVSKYSTTVGVDRSTVWDYIDRLEKQTRHTLAYREKTAGKGARAASGEKKTGGRPTPNVSIQGEMWAALHDHITTLIALARGNVHQEAFLEFLQDGTAELTASHKYWLGRPGTSADMVPDYPNPDADEDIQANNKQPPDYGEVETTSGPTSIQRKPTWQEIVGRNTEKDV